MNNQNIEKKESLWPILTHLSHFLNFIIPFGGYIALLVIWIVNRDEKPYILPHVKVVLNWALTTFIYLIAAIILMFCFVSQLGYYFCVLFMVAIALLNFIYPIIGAVKASQNEIWKYPLSIEFIKVLNN